MASNFCPSLIAQKLPRIADSGTCGVKTFSCGVGGRLAIFHDQAIPILEDDHPLGLQAEVATPPYGPAFPPPLPRCSTQKSRICSANA
jgi:hypothetical protein